jgi:type II secretory pathway pseudopilin PulG
MSDTPAPNRGLRILLIVFGAVGCLGLAVAAVPVVGIVAAIAIPNFVAMQLKAKRSEVPANMDGIRTAELAYDAAFDEFVPVGSREEAEQELRSGGKEQRSWRGGAAWEKLGWRPDGMIRGAYWVEVAPDGKAFTVHGLCDVDGDREYAEFTADGESRATGMTNPDVY